MTEFLAQAAFWSSSAALFSLAYDFITYDDRKKARELHQRR